MKKGLLFCAFLFSGLCWGQIEDFTPARPDYLAELEEMLRETDVDRDETLEPLISEFSGVWLSDSVSAKEAQFVYQISNHLRRKRIGEFEHWRNFLKVFTWFQIEYQDTTPLPLLRDLEKYTEDRPSRSIEEYLNTHYQVLYNNALNKTSRVEWSYIGEFEYSYDGEPIYTFKELDLWGRYRNDSTELAETSGIYYPKSYTFKGSGGRSFFTRAGLTKDSAYVELAQYSIDVTKSDFRADSVLLHSKIYPKRPTLGYFEEKLTSQSDHKDNSFPRFFSYRKDIVIDNLIPGAYFKGSFAMIGSKFYGGGTDSNRAEVSFSYKDTILVRARSDRFLLRTDKLYSENVEVRIYLGQDSIYHPKVSLRYLPNNKQFSIIRKDEGMGQTAFTNTFHNVSMKFDIANWKLGEPLMTLGNLNLGSKSPVIFESENYFRTRRYDQIQGVSSRNPLVKLKNMRQTYGRKHVTVDEVAHYLKMSERNAHIFMMRMAIYGFVQYNVDTRKGVLTDKIYDYILNQKGVRDFDVIQFVSSVEQGNNARLSLEDYSMEINGVDRIALSDSQKVGLFPRDSKLTLYKGLNFDFNGKISAGLFNFWGDNMEFNYEQFRINMETVDSMRFKVRSFTKNARGYRELKRVRTVLQELNGELQIDKPNNKSGKDYYSEYPIFKSGTNSFIYYDKEQIFDSVYNRQEFYVELEPFTIDSLDNISTQGLKFDGTFTSAGIFPDMPQTITVQRDYSLGFNMATPAAGLSAYGGKGTFTDSVFLSNQGLRGKGRIDYNAAVAESKEFFFFPDSTNGLAYNYDIEAQTGAADHPHVSGDSVFIHWEPYNDQMFASNRGEPFEMYDDIGMKADGELAYGPGGLSGKGLLQFLNAETRSKDYDFQNRKFSSDSLAFRVRANEDAEWGFAVDNATADVDFDKQKGEFALNDPDDFFRFPDNKYICTMDFAKWEIPKKAVQVSKQSASTRAKMISMKPQQDSLRFEADRARFYLENSLLESFEVPEIRVADASIVPDTGYVAIEANAKMRTLQNAAITANRSTQYHQFLGGTIDIRSRNDYSGTADYEYLDKDGTPWPLRFHTVEVDSTGTTIGKADIDKEEYFYMSPQFAYHGKAWMKADRKALKFRGKTHIESDCPMISTDWFAFESLVDPDNIVIDLPEVDPEDATKTLANGIYLASDTISGFAAFLSRDVSPNDQQMFFTTGKLYFDDAINSYVITSRDSLQDTTSAANVLEFNSANCTLHGKGEMSLGEPDEQFTINSYGTIDYNLNNDEMVLDLAVGFNFFFDDEIQDRMATNISLESDGDGSDYTRPVFQTMLKDKLDLKDRREFLSDVRDYGAPEELPKDLRHTILLSNLTLKWTPESRSFLSEGTIGIAAFGEYFVNRKVEGSFELQRKRSGDELNMYWDVAPGLEYFIEYKRGMMRVYSSSQSLMDYIKELDLKDRRNDEKGMRPFTYTIGTDGRMNRFLRRYDMFNE